jgi:DNA-binding HxlR family transcriptional regulator
MADKMADKQHPPYRHSIHKAMGVLAGQWVTAVLASLVAGRRTYTDLLKDINDHEARWNWSAHSRPLAQKVLTETLSRMQRNGLITRWASDPSRTFSNIWYELTPSGQELVMALRPLAKWGEEHDEDQAETRDTQAP